MSILHFFPIYGKLITDNMVSRVKILRKSLRLKQWEFAEKLGLTQSAVSMIESGQYPLSEKNLRFICVTFNVSERWLRDGEGEMFEAAEPSMSKLMEVFRQLSPGSREFLLEMAQKLLEKQGKEG
jgi:transcriptional regulator with XRE-family HTH domain